MVPITLKLQPSLPKPWKRFRLHSSLTSALDGGEKSNWRVGRSTRDGGEEAKPALHWIGVWCAPGRVSNCWDRENSDICYKILGNLRRQNICRIEENVGISSLLYNFNVCTVCTSAYTESPCIFLMPIILQISDVPLYSKVALRRQDRRRVQWGSEGTTVCRLNSLCAQHEHKQGEQKHCSTRS